eukprot:TRINITY_DN1739_c0_g4_i1.p1 TRINITY_DN1739_c0_g4~~TRINITY_DN1739_c0_g4_i1.p1  ORF type:complete len:880 (+),score=221.35 TRINITY_DN1739_c0_g4_i1:486-3125(+)
MLVYLEKQRTVLTTLRSCQMEAKSNSSGSGGGGGGGARRQRSLSKGFLVVTLRLEEPKPREWQHGSSQIGTISDISNKQLVTLNNSSTSPLSPQHQHHNHTSSSSNGAVGDHQSGNHTGRRWEQKPAAPTSGVADDADAFDSSSASSNSSIDYHNHQAQQRYSSMKVKSQLAAIWNERKEGDSSTDNWSDDDDDDDDYSTLPTSSSSSSMSSTPPLISSTSSSSLLTSTSSLSSSSAAHPPELQRTHSETLSTDSRKLSSERDGEGKGSPRQAYFSRKITFSHRSNSPESPNTPTTATKPISSSSPSSQSSLNAGPVIVWQKLDAPTSEETEKRKEEFRKNLIGDWDSEIAAMDSEKARWFIERMESERADRLMEALGRTRPRKDTITSTPASVTAFPAKQRAPFNKTPSGILGRAKQKMTLKKDRDKVEKDRKGKLIAKQFRETRSRLEKYRNVLQKSISNQEINYKMLKAQETQLLQEIRSEIEKFTQWANPNLVLCYRKFVIAKLGILDVQLRRSKIKLGLAKFKLDVASEDIETLRDGLPLVFTADYFKDPESITNHDIEALTHIEKILENAKKGLGRAFIRARSKAVVDDRVARLKSIIDSTALDGSNMYHAYHEIMQNEFNFFLLDARYPEGNKIKRLCEALSNATQRIPPEEIINFLEDFVNELADQNKFLSFEDTNKLRVFVYRAVFPRIFTNCFVPLRNDPQNKENNKRFALQIQWLRKLSPEEIDVDLAKYWKLLNLSYNGPHPFSRAWELLEYLPYELVPTDMLLIVKDTMLLINEIGRDITNSMLSTDDVFPILLYVTIHADIHNVFEHLEYMELYASPSDRMGQLGFCLTSLSAACNHILNMSPSDLQINNNNNNNTKPSTTIPSY